MTDGSACRWLRRMSCASPGSLLMFEPGACDASLDISMGCMALSVAVGHAPDGSDGLGEAICEWTRKHLADDDLDWLARLPFALAVATGIRCAAASRHVLTAA